MTSLVALKLIAIFVVVGIGWVVGRLDWLTPAELRAPRRGGAGQASGQEDDDDVIRSPALQPGANDPSRALANAAYYIFVPALLFRTTARIDLGSMPWGTLAAVFVPLMAVLLGIHAQQRRANRDGRLPPAAPAVRSITAVFGNTVQVGIPLATALFGERGLQLHLAIVSLHSLVLLTTSTALVEVDLAGAERRAGGAGARLGALLGSTARKTLIHPVVTPVLVGLGWNALALPLPAVADEILLTLGAAVVPVCLVLIGVSLAHHGVRGSVRPALTITAIKLVGLPALVLVVAKYGVGLAGLPLTVAVMLAALPIGSNPLIFAQRYRTLEAETTAATVFSTLGFMASAPLWLVVLGRMGGVG